MFLEYGLNQHGEMIHIDQAKRGLGDLLCPYCSGQLIARKGSEKIHHFAHAGETCREVSEREAVKLPYYDKFDLGLSPLQLQTLEEIYKGSGEYNATLFKEGFIKESYNTRSRMFSRYEPTHLGNIPFGATSLSKFEELQAERILKQYEKLAARIRESQENINELTSLIQKLEKQAEDPPKFLFFNEKHANQKIESYQASLIANESVIKFTLTDLNIYRAQLRRVFAASLYFLEIKHSGGTLYKVGVTNRPIEERIEEISRDIAPHITGAKISVLRQLAHRGAIEFYFKHRYRENQQRLGSLTEYFLFEDRKAVLSDLSRLGDYTPDDFMLAILRGEASEIERSIEEEKRRTIEEERQQLLREQHRAATKAGMEQAAAAGVHIGRPKDEAAATLAKFPQVVELLKAGKAIKAIERETGIAKNTIKKVRAALGD